MIALLLALQDAAAGLPSVPGLSDMPFDLRTAPRTAGDAIVVVGRRRDMRLAPLPEGFEPHRELRAGFDLSGSSGMTLDLAPATLPNGLPSNRIMLTWKMTF
jgi:hypothetical protein